MSKALDNYIKEEFERMWQSREKSYNEASDRVMARILNPNQLPAKEVITKEPSTKKKSYDSLGDLSKLQMRIFKLLKEHGPLSRQQIANMLGVKVSSICGCAKPLVDNSFLCVSGRVKDKETGKDVEALQVVEV